MIFLKRRSSVKDMGVQPNHNPRESTTLVKVLESDMCKNTHSHLTQYTSHLVTLMSLTQFFVSPTVTGSSGVPDLSAYSKTQVGRVCVCTCVLMSCCMSGF